MYIHSQNGHLSSGHLNSRDHQSHISRNGRCSAGSRVEGKHPRWVRDLRLVLLGAHGPPVLLEVAANFVHDFLIVRIVPQVVVILVTLKPRIVVIAQRHRPP